MGNIFPYIWLSKIKANQIMRKVIKSLLILSVVVGNTLSYSFADRGVRSRSRKNISLNINTSNNFRNSLSLNLKTGLKYNGIEFTENTPPSCFIQGSAVKLYQKGNTVYLVPNQQKIIIPEMKQGYTGMKLILKP